MSSTKQGEGVNPLDNIKPMPDSIKYGLMGLLVLVLMILWFVFSSGDSDDSQSQTLVDLEKPVQNLESEIDSQVPASLPIEPFAENKSEIKLADKSDLLFVNQAQEGELKLTKLEDQLNQLILDNIMLDEEVKTLHIDIYFVDTQNKIDDDKIRRWAKRQNIDAQRLKAGSITLNHDKGSLYRMTQKFTSSVPLVFSINAKKLTRIYYLKRGRRF